MLNSHVIIWYLFRVKGHLFQPPEIIKNNLFSMVFDEKSIDKNIQKYINKQ